MEHASNDIRTTPTDDHLRHLLIKSFETAYNSAHPRTVMAPYIPSPPKGRTIVIGAGKAAAAMAVTFEENYDAPYEGLIIAPHDQHVKTRHIKIRHGAHPVPDEKGTRAVEEMLNILETTTEDDLIICLISGGGSSLLSCPVDGITISDLQSLYTALLRCGANITEINTIRKHLNKALGGGLAAAAPKTPMVTLAISDVIGDDPSIIASGASVADPSCLSEAQNVLETYKISATDAITRALQNPDNETPKPNNTIFRNKDYSLIATPKQMLEYAAAFWEENGFIPYILGDTLAGDTNECAKMHVALLEETHQKAKAAKKPYAVLSGGETTVTITGNGTGGPNTQFMLQSAILLNKHPSVYGMACDTDGKDGVGDNAGALITPQTLEKVKNKTISPENFLKNNDAYHFFAPLNDLVITGPTHTNVNDYRVFLVLP